jgi:hypothetical protein
LSPQRIFGLVLLGVGIVLLLLGIQTPEPVVDTAKEGAVGPNLDRAMWYLVGGSAMALVGIALSLLGGSRRLNSR